MNMEVLLSPKQKVEWERLPLDVLVEIGKFVAEIDGNVTSMRATCKDWKAGVGSVATALTPLGLPSRYSAFSHISTINLASRNHGHAVTSSELATLCAAAPNATHINVNEAHQIASLSPLTGMKALTLLSLDRTAVTDPELVAILPSLSALISLSLKECIFLKGEFISTLVESTVNLRRLDISNIGLALHINPSTGRAISALSSLEILCIGGNTVCDTTAGCIASLPRLKALSLKDSHMMSEAGLEEIAAGPAGQILEILDLEGCQGVGEGFWAALSRLKCLKELSLARMPQLLQSAPMPDYAAAALWRWPAGLRKLCIAGSNVHPTKLKLLAAACGLGLQELDLSVPGSSSSSSAPSSPSRPPFSRLTSHQVRDLVESARCLKQLRKLNAARTGLPLEAAVAFMRAAPRIEHLDLSGCSLGPRIGLGAQPRATAGQLWSSGIFIPGSGIPYRAEAADVSNSLAAPGPEEFALALGALTTLSTLRLEDCGLKPEHVRHVQWLKSLVNVSFAGNKGIGNVVAQGLAASARFLENINLSGTSLTDEGLGFLHPSHSSSSSESNSNTTGIVENTTVSSPNSSCGSTSLRRLHTLSLARCGPGISIAGLQALVKGGGVPPLRSLTLSDCVSINTECVELIASSFSKLTHLNLSGCLAVKADGVDALPALRLLQNLDVSRCGDSLTDTGLGQLCSHLSQLTGLKLDGARKLTGEGLSALSTLRVLAELDLTCCAGLGDDDEDVKKKLSEGMIATVQLPQGGRATISSPLVKHRQLGQNSNSLAGPLPQI